MSKRSNLCDRPILLASAAEMALWRGVRSTRWRAVDDGRIVSGAAIVRWAVQSGGIPQAVLTCVYVTGRGETVEWASPTKYVRIW